ncbi:MAG: UDP-N-acetylmuramate dehydrogenase [Clostridiales bacterium]|nr:UDP-N-acetylmuramate dehydrogenase [Clostridiales bacterium]
MRDSLSAWTTFGIGGRAKRLRVARSRGELIDFAPSSLVLGRGSNILASDDGYDGNLTINRYETIAHNGVLVTAGSGTRLYTLCAYLKENGLSGMEWAVGIPASVGGALVMNAGAFGGQMKDAVVYADVLRGGRLIRLDARELGLSYRHSGLSNDDTVIDVAFGLKRDSKASIDFRHKSYALLRKQKQPMGKSAGSVFKNPQGVSVGRLLDEAGIKGTRIGGAVISDKHANVIINADNATAKDVTELIKLCKRVLEDMGVTAQEEIKYIGNFD